MTNRYPDHQISAYYDGELTPAEREAVEQSLAESSEARQELEEYRLLSEMLRELPRETLPREFAAEVMQAAERRMLLAPPAASSEPTKTRRPRWLWTFAPLASAAVVLLALFWPRPEGKIGEFEGGKPPVATFEPQGAAAPLRRPAEFAAASSPDAESAGNAEAVQPLMARSEQGELLRQSRGHSPAAAPEAATMSTQKPAAALTAAAADSSVAADESHPDRRLLPLMDAGAPPLVVRQNLRGVRVGEMIEALETGENEVAVVRLWVVERQQGLEQLQLVLSRQEIPEEPSANFGEPPATLAADRAAAKPEQTPEDKQTRPGKRPDDLIAVYVEASNEQLAAAFEALRRDDKTFVEIGIDSPVPLPVTEGVVARADLALALQTTQAAMTAAEMPDADRPPPPALPTSVSPALADAKPATKDADRVADRGATDRNITSTAGNAPGMLARNNTERQSRDATNGFAPEASGSPRAAQPMRPAPRGETRGFQQRNYSGPRQMVLNVPPPASRLIETANRTAEPLGRAPVKETETKAERKDQGEASPNAIASAGESAAEKIPAPRAAPSDTRAQQFRQRKVAGSPLQVLIVVEEVQQ